MRHIRDFTLLHCGVVRRFLLGRFGQFYLLLSDLPPKVNKNQNQHILFIENNKSDLRNTFDAKNDRDDSRNVFLEAEPEL